MPFSGGSLWPVGFQRVKRVCPKTAQKWPSCSNGVRKVRNLSLSATAFQITSRWYLGAWECPYDCHSISQKFPRVAFESVPHWSDWEHPFLFFQQRLLSISSFHGKPMLIATWTNCFTYKLRQQKKKSSNIHISLKNVSNSKWMAKHTNKEYQNVISTKQTT